MQSISFGEVIGRGMERICYANPNNPFTCFKVSKIGHDLQTRREIRYFEFLKKHHIEADFLPKYFGFIKTDKYLIIEQELFVSDEQYQAQLVNHFLQQATNEEIAKLEEKFRKIKAEMIEKNIIISDIRPANILVLSKIGIGIQRVVFLDGFGSPEFIPLPIYCPFFGKKKIERQWEKFKHHYYNAKRK